jgi:hypothetical protein
MSINPAGEADKWAGLLLPEALAALHRYAQKEMRGELTPQMLSELQRQRGQKPGSFKVTLSKARNFVKASRTELVKIMKDGFRVLAKKDRDYLASAVRVEKALAGIEAALCQVMPNFSRGEAERWPGPIGYRVALNHFVAVSLRIHSIFPKAGYELVVSRVAEVVLTPILAHNLSFLLRSNPEIFRVITGDGKARDDDAPNKSLLAWYAERGKWGTKADEDYPAPSSLSDSEREALSRWKLLFDAIVHFHPFGDETHRQFKLIRELVTEHVENPAMSRLWSSLADLASGDLAADEMMVAKVIQQGADLFKGTDQSPLVNCARARFGLLRFAYDMDDEASLLRAKPEEALQEAEKAIVAHEGYGYPQHTDVAQANQLFGWAYLLSRRILLGRNVKGNPGYGLSDDLKNADSVLAVEWRAARLLERLFASLTRPSILQPDAPARRFGILALRYWAGLRSNPRFIIDAREASGTSYIEVAITRLRKDDAREIPKGVIWMLMARNALHQAYLCRGIPQKYLVQLDQTLAHYSRTLDAILDAKAKFEEDTSVKNTEGTMDGEIAAWCIPEMVAALTMKEEATKDKREKVDIGRYRKALITAGEVQFGIYFNPESEMRRINEGLRIRCGIKRQV